MDKKNYYPVMLNLTTKSALIIGLGAVGLRKLKGLVDKSANIYVISKEIKLETKEQVNRLKTQSDTSIMIIEEALDLNKHYEYLENSDIIFICTDNILLNQEIETYAKSNKIWHLRCDDATHSDFINPITIQKQELLLAISTSGASPIYCQYLKSEIEKVLETLDINKLKLLDLARKKIKSQNDYETKAKLLEKLVHMSKEELEDIIGEEIL